MLLVGMKNDFFVKIISHLGGEAPATTAHYPTLSLHSLYPLLQYRNL